MVHLMKKITGVILLLVFILSVVPVALAEDNERSIRGERLEREAAAAVREKASDMARGLENTQPKVQERLEELRERADHAKERYEETRERYAEQKEQLAVRRAAAAACDNGKMCEDERRDVRINARLHILRVNDVITHTLEKLARKVDASTLSDAEKNGTLQLIAEMIDKLAAEKKLVEQQAQDATNEELKEAITQLKELWREARVVQQRVVSLLTQEKISSLVDSHESISNGMAVRIEALREDGKDVTQLVELFEKFTAAVENLHADQARARAAWETAQTRTERLDVWRQAQAVVRQDLQETKQILREFVRAYDELREA